MTLKRLKYFILVFYVALFVFLGVYDERVDPDLQRDLAVPRAEVIASGNAWLAILGFDAPAGVSPVAYGAKRMRDVAQAIEDGKCIEDVIFAPDKEIDLSFKGKAPSFYGKESAGVMAYAHTHRAEIASLSRDNAELFSRYEQLSALTRFTEPLACGYYTPFPRFAPLRSSQQLLLLRLSLQAEQGDLTGALARLGEDMAFWRMVVRNSETLISKLISVAMVKNDLTFAAELGASKRLTPSELALVRELLQPFEWEEVSFAKAFKGETIYSYYGMQQTLSKTKKRWSPDRLTMKRNATINKLYAYNREFAGLAALTPQQYAERVGRHASLEADSFKIGLSGLYNPAGEILALIAIPQTSGYIEKGHNMEGLRRLGLLKVLAHAKGLAPERLQAFLDAHAADLGDPYTGKPMRWDAENERIYYPALSGDKRVELHY